MKANSLRKRGFAIYNTLIVLMCVTYFLIRPIFGDIPHILWCVLGLALAFLLMGVQKKKGIFKRLSISFCSIGVIAVLILTNLGDQLSVGVVNVNNHRAISILREQVAMISEYDNRETIHWLFESKESQITNEEKKVLKDFLNNNPGIRISKGFLYYPIGNDWSSFPKGYALNLLDNDKAPSNYKDCWNFLYHKITRNWYFFTAACIY